MTAGKDGFIILIQINRIIYDDFIIKLHESKLRVNYTLPAVMLIKAGQQGNLESTVFIKTTLACFNNINFM